MKLIGTIRSLDDGRGAVRLEEEFDTGVDDLWQACTAPDRLARWIGDVDGDLRVGGQFRARFTSGWEGTGRVETCDPPRRLTVVTTEAGATEDTRIEVTLSPAPAEPGVSRTVLVIEERGLPVDQLAAYGAGWQVHVEDLAAHLAGRQRCDLPTRWGELFPHYRAASS